jgi:hypothetical protein
MTERLFESTDYGTISSLLTNKPEAVSTVGERVSWLFSLESALREAGLDELAESAENSAHSLVNEVINDVTGVRS